MKDGHVPVSKLTTAVALAAAAAARRCAAVPILFPPCIFFHKQFYAARTHVASTNRVPVHYSIQWTGLNSAVWNSFSEAPSCPVA